MGSLKSLFQENYLIKSVLAVFAISASWVFNGEYHALISICSLFLIDFITGTIVAIRLKNWSSSRSRSGVVKIGLYFMFILISRLVDKVMVIKFASPLIDSYIVLTEAGSIFENAKKLGYEIPEIFIKKFKSVNQDTEKQKD